RDRPACAIEAEIGDVMLSARIKASADLDMKIADRFIEREQPIRKARSNLTGKSARRRNPEFARIRTRACNHIEDCPRPGLTQSHAYEFAIQIRKIGFGYPPQYDVLFDRRPKIVAAESPGDVRELPRLCSSHIA